METNVAHNNCYSEKILDDIKRIISDVFRNSAILSKGSSLACIFDYVLMAIRLIIFTMEKLECNNPQLVSLEDIVRNQEENSP
jgi:hypothetical protein